MVSPQNCYSKRSTRHVYCLPDIHETLFLPVQLFFENPRKKSLNCFFLQRSFFSNCFFGHLEIGLNSWQKILPSFRKFLMKVKKDSKFYSFARKLHFSQSVSLDTWKSVLATLPKSIRQKEVFFRSVPEILVSPYKCSLKSSAGHVECLPGKPVVCVSNSSFSRKIPGKEYKMNSSSGTFFKKVSGHVDFNFDIRGELVRKERRSCFTVIQKMNSKSYFSSTETSFFSKGFSCHAECVFWQICYPFFPRQLFNFQSDPERLQSLVSPRNLFSWRGKKLSWQTWSFLVQIKVFYRIPEKIYSWICSIFSLDA